MSHCQARVSSYADNVSGRGEVIQALLLVLACRLTQIVAGQRSTPDI